MKNYFLLLLGIMLFFGTTTSMAAEISPVSATYTGNVHALYPLANFYDGDSTTIAVLEGNPGLDPAGQIITLTFDQTYDFSDVSYWGDNDLGDEQGLNSYTLEFFSGGVSQGTFSGAFLSQNNTVRQDQAFGSTYTADTITLTINTTHPGGVLWGNVSSEITFEGIAMAPIPTVGEWGMIIMTLGLLIGATIMIKRRSSVAVNA